MNFIPLISGLVKSFGTFEQVNPDSLDFLARRMFRATINLDELLNEVERDGGMELQQVLEHSGSTTKSTSRGDNWNEDESESNADNWSNSLANALNWGDGVVQQESDTESETDSEQESGGESEKIDPTRPYQRLNEKTANRAKGKAKAKAKGKAHATSASKTRGGSLTRTGGTGGGRTVGRKKGRGGNSATGEANTDGWSLKHIQVRKVIREKVRTGQLQRSVADQFEEAMKQIYCLKEREAFFCIGSELVKIRTHDVPDPFKSPAALVKAVNWLIRELPHKYLFVPDLSVDEEERRVRAFLDNPVSAVIIDELA